MTDKPDPLLTTAADMARRRVYVLTDRGTMISGLPAIRLIWANLPRWRLLSRIAGLPGVRWLGEALYDRIIAPTIWRANIARRERAVISEKAAR